jgi:large subunit ribosomal protein L3
MSNSLGILGKKIGMTQIFAENGNAIPVTVVKVGPCYITQIKSVENNNYKSIQIGYQNIPKFKLNKPELGHLEKHNNLCLKYLKEYPVENIENFTLGQVIDINNFKEGEFVDVTSKSIGKGFAGNQKRNNFSRGPMTHGSKNHREPGSIGQSTTPGRVFPGKRMAGRLGGTQVTISKLKIFKIDAQENLLIIKGSVPGKPGNLLSIKLTKRF